MAICLKALASGPEVQDLDLMADVGLGYVTRCSTSSLLFTVSEIISEMKESINYTSNDNQSHNKQVLHVYGPHE